MSDAYSFIWNEPEPLLCEDCGGPTPRYYERSDMKYVCRECNEDVQSLDPDFQRELREEL